jgi:amino acid transporter
VGSESFGASLLIELSGWLTVFAWIATTASTPAFLSNIVTGLVIFNFPDYVPERWHGTLIMWGFVVVTVVFNLWFRKLINPLELFGGICHVLCFIVTLISLAVLARRSSADFVFNNLTHEAPGWTNPAAAFSIGLLTVTFPLSGFDGVLHMSDEVKAPRVRVPRSMIMSVAMNWVMQFAFVVTLLFCIGDIDKVANTPTGMPMIEVYNEALQSKSGTTFLMVVIAVIAVIAMFNMIASVSRLVWAFSKDKGLPFSATFSHVDQRLHIPLNSLLLVGVICCLLAIINIGSSTAFNALLSLPTIGLYLSYLVPITLLLIRKIRGMHPHYGPFKLGVWGIPVNMFACAYAIYIL